MNLSVVVTFATPYVVVNNLTASYYIHYFQAWINTSCHAGADDAIGLVGADEFYCSGRSIYLADTALGKDEGVSVDFTFGIRVYTVGNLFLIF